MIDKLITLAESGLEESLTTEEAIDRIARYTEALAEYTDDEGEIHLPDAEEQEMKRLGDLHTAILAKAQNLQKSAARDLASLHKKGKGILSYIDVFPKSISTRKNRKG